MRQAWLIGVVGVLIVTAGCSTRKSSLLLERSTRGPLDEALQVGERIEWHLEPVYQTKTNNNVQVNVNHASAEFLKGFFKNKEIFGAYAGKSPFFPEHLVFYVKFENRSAKKIRLDPTDFLLVDDLGNQYGMLSIDYITAFAEYRAPVATTTRGVLSEASPGYFGFSLPVGKMFASKPQGRFALVKQASIQPGYMYPGVIHDGLITFWSPNAKATKLRLLVTNVKTDFDANDFPQTSLEFPFEFTATHPGRAEDSAGAPSQ